MSSPRLFKTHAPTAHALLAAADFLVCFLAFYAGVWVRFQGDIGMAEASVGTPLWRALLFATTCVIGLTTMGLYQKLLREQAAGLLLRIAVGLLLGFISLTIVYYLFPALYSGRGISGVAYLVAFALVALLRPLFYKIVDQESVKPRVVVLGAGDRASLITRRMRRRSDQRGFHLMGFIEIDGETTDVPEHRLLRPEGPLLEFCERAGIEEIVVAVDDRRGGLDMDELLRCRLRGIRVTELISFFEREAGKVKLELLHPGWLVFSDGFARTSVRNVSKRVFDVVVSAALLLATLPVMLIAALAILLESGRGAPVLYKQVRVGESGREFELLKFRSMRTDAEDDGEAKWAAADDDRVTRVGRIIRPIRIDELPQVFNVLRGDMSFVGPRPERPEFVDKLAAQIPFYRERHCVNPGITGWAQVCYPYGSSESDAAEKLKFDLYYVKNHTLLLDLSILLRTVETIVFGRGR